MCYNCGCEISDDDMGRGILSKGGASLVDEDFQNMATKWGMTIEETKKNVYKLLGKQFDLESVKTKI